MDEVTSSYSGSGFASGPSHMGEMPTQAPGGLDMFSGGCKRPFDITCKRDALKVNKGTVFCGTRKEVEADELTLSKDFSGTVYLVVSWDSSGEFSAELTDSEPDADDTESVARKLYDFEDGKPVMDYRMCPVFVVYN